MVVVKKVGHLVFSFELDLSRLFREADSVLLTSRCQFLVSALEALVLTSRLFALAAVCGDQWSGGV